MSKIIVLLIVVFFIILSLLAFFNKGAVDLKVWNGVTFENIPVIAVILVSTSVGIFSMFIVIAIRDAKRYFESWQLQRQQKKEIKTQDLYSKGMDAFHAGRIDEASEMFMRVIDSDPAHLDARLRIGDILFNKGDLVKARENYLKAKDIKAGSIEALLSLEKVAHARQKWQEALKHLDSILDIDDGNLKALIKKRDVYEKNNKWEEVIEVQNRILKTGLSPEHERKEQINLTGFRCEQARAQLDSGDTDRAIKALRSVIKTDKDFVEAYLILAEAYKKAGNTGDAEETLKKGHEEASSRVMLAKLEDFYIAQGEPGRIIDYYQKILENNQNDLSLQFFLAKLYYRLEMIDYAFDTINSIDVSAFDNPEIHTLLGCIYSRREEHDKASEEFKKALRVVKAVIIPYCCANCNYKSKSWSGRCPDCGSWNSLTLDINEACNIPKRHSSS